MAETSQEIARDIVVALVSGMTQRSEAGAETVGKMFKIIMKKVVEGIDEAYKKG